MDGVAGESWSAHRELVFTLLWGMQNRSLSIHDVADSYNALQTFGKGKFKQQYRSTTTPISTSAFRPTTLKPKARYNHAYIVNAHHTQILAQAYEVKALSTQIYMPTDANDFN
jgi:hypothetical protein